jgi:hypothetical protein
MAISIRLFPRQAAFLRLNVLAVEVNESLPGHVTQPGIERQRTVAEIVGQLLPGFGQGLLDHVRRIDAGRQTGIHAHGHHLGQLRPMPVQELGDGPLVPAASLAQQFVGVRGRSGHGLTSSSI